MGLSTAITSKGRRLPDRLEDLHGPWQGIVISQGRRHDVARFLNAQRLREDWPQLRPLVSSKTAGPRAPARTGNVLTGQREREAGCMPG